MLSEKVISLIRIYPIPDGIANSMWHSSPRNDGRLCLCKPSAI